MDQVTNCIFCQFVTAVTNGSRNNSSKSIILAQYSKIICWLKNCPEMPQYPQNVTLNISILLDISYSIMHHAMSQLT